MLYLSQSNSLFRNNIKTVQLRLYGFLLIFYSFYFDSLILKSIQLSGAAGYSTVPQYSHIFCPILPMGAPQLGLDRCIYSVLHPPFQLQYRSIPAWFVLSLPIHSDIDRQPDRPQTVARHLHCKRTTPPGAHMAAQPSLHSAVPPAPSSAEN